MKRLISAALTVLLLLGVALSLASCSKTAPPIDFGKKYTINSNAKTYYVFEEDQTGYCEYYFKYEDKKFPEYNYTQSGRIEFVWREASNGAIYLFETKVSYHDDHTKGKALDLITDPIYFSEEFFTYSYSNQYGGRTVNYIKEGSELEKSIKK